MEYLGAVKNWSVFANMESSLRHNVMWKGQVGEQYVRYDTIM